MSNPLLSIGVPVYNVEKYLRKCLDSLINQTFRDIEIIIVNDGSTDSSGEICKEYEQKDTRIKLINKENEGLASARQAALEASIGQYFCACDADDWVEPNMYERLYKKAEETNADVVMCDYYSEYGDGITKALCYGKEVPVSNRTIIENALNGRFPCSVWNKLYKKNTFDKYNISWEPGINMGEDLLINLKILQNPVKYVYLPEPLYHYRRIQGEDSYTNHVTLNSYNQMLRIQDWIEKNFDYKLHAMGINHHLINIAFAGLRVDKGMTANYYKLTSISRLDVLSLLSEHSLKSLVILWTKLFGYQAGVMVYNLMYKRFYR